MPTSKQKKVVADKSKEYQAKIKDNEKKLNKQLLQLQKIRDARLCFPLLMGETDIVAPVVDDTFEELQLKYKSCNGKLDVIVDSGGGDIDAAYNLANLLRKFGTEELNFIVPRWAKSAATLLVCSGDSIVMTPVAELGPLDPQITQFNPLEKRLEQFSPLHMEATLELIRKEFTNGNEKLANSLMQRLQFPMTLGSFTKSLDISEQYLTKLLSSRMLKGEDSQKIKGIAKQLTTGYADHGFCINIDEARQLGLKILDPKSEELDILWQIHKLSKGIAKLKRKIREGEMAEMFEALPPELLSQLPPSLRQKPKNKI